MGVWDRFWFQMRWSRPGWCGVLSDDGVCRHVNVGIPLSFPAGL